MEKNQCTIEELQKKLDSFIDKKGGNCIYEFELLEMELYYETIEECSLKMYFPCTDGVGCTEIYMEAEVYTLYKGTKFKKMEQRHLDEIANYYAHLQKEIEKVERLMGYDRIRGLFTKMKASK